MNKYILPFIACFPFLGQAQSYAPPAGQPGSTAVPHDSPSIVAWATGGTITRGLMQIDKPELGYASYGAVENAFGPVTVGSGGNGVVSLGDSGSITLTFNKPIKNGEGADFLVFENSFGDTFLELAFVEVSSDGERFVRFPAYSETQTDTQVGGFGNIDCRYIHNLAGKYKMGFGTPFDLEDIKDSTNIDLERISHVRIIDVIGTIDPQYASRDVLGRIINDPFSTPFNTSGFDLDGVAVINEGEESDLAVEKTVLTVSAYPNPVNDQLYLTTNKVNDYKVSTINGQIITAGSFQETVSISTVNWEKGLYILEVSDGTQIHVQKIVKQ